jgi:hypothetical protein
VKLGRNIRVPRETFDAFVTARFIPERGRAR